MSAASSGGRRSLTDLFAHMQRLADWLVAHKPDCKVMTVTRRDFELLKKNLGHQGLTEDARGELFWRGFTLHPLPQRYPPR